MVESELEKDPKFRLRGLQEVSSSAIGWWRVFDLFLSFHALSRVPANSAIRLDFSLIRVVDALCCYVGGNVDS